eukprot:PhM_4_TR373/c0_g1_i1/m.67946
MMYAPESQHQQPPNNNNARGIYVGNVDPSITAQELKTFFSAAGKVLTVNMMGPEGGTHRYAFLDFTTEDERNRAISMFNGQLVAGKALKVAESKGTVGGNPRGGGGGGG